MFLTIAVNTTFLVWTWILMRLRFNQRAHHTKNIHMSLGLCWILDEVVLLMEGWWIWYKLLYQGVGWGCSGWESGGFFFSSRFVLAQVFKKTTLVFFGIIRMSSYQYRNSHCGDKTITTIRIPTLVRLQLYIESAHSCAAAWKDGGKLFQLRRSPAERNWTVTMNS